MASKAEHDYHLVNPSPWPLASSFFALVLAVGAVVYMKGLFGLSAGTPWLMVVGLLGIMYCMAGWWRDVVRESQAGDHTPVVQLGLRYGMILFIASEVMFFVAWFWAYFNSALFPEAGELGNIAKNEVLGGTWPPQGIYTPDPWHLPLYNTLILLLSGTTVTWAHHALLENNRKELIWGLSLTIALGVIFSMLQAYEYGLTEFDFSGNIFGAVFFMATGFHGFHVIVGTIFLAACLIRVLKGQLTPKKHFGFEAAAWYWHFVDVVWLFLFITIYVWGARVGAH